MKRVISTGLKGQYNAAMGRAYSEMDDILCLALKEIDISVKT